jgi:taurine--2-oxoglutarate transaminase
MTSTIDGGAPPLLDAEGARRAYELDRKHVFHSWSAQDLLDPMVISAAQGSYVWDGEGKKYLDFSSQLVNTNIGHQHPAVVSAIAEQAAKLCTIAPSYVNDARSEAARLISERTPGDLNKIFFTNGGADANEHAVRMARLHTGRQKVLSAYRSYHGGTQLAVNLTGDPRRWASDTASTGTVHFFPPYLYRTAFHSTTEEEESSRALEHLEQLIAYEGPDTIAAIILESIPGTAGIYLPPPGYLQGVRELCNRYGIIFIADEVMSGFGRTGKWFAVDHFDVVPDLLTFAKGVNSGYVPMGGVAISPEIAATFGKRVYPGGLTYSGHPLAAAAAVATINAMEDEGMVEHAAELGRSVIGPALAGFAERHVSVGEVRGTGVFWAIELVKDRETREPLAPYGSSSGEMNQLLAACKERGLLPFGNFNRIHVVPPCNTSAADTEAGLGILDEVLEIADGLVREQQPA